MTTIGYSNCKEPIHYKHDVTVYVPCYQKNNTFVYSLADADKDEQMVWAMKPDYVLVLTGIFDATSDPKKEIK